MTSGCRTANAHDLAAEVLKQMDDYKINGILVTDETGKLVGALNMHDLLRAGIL